LADIVVDAKDNAIKAEGEIKLAEKETRSQTKKIACLSFIVVFVAASVVLLCYFIFK